jgi:hypothetical protein
MIFGTIWFFNLLLQVGLFIAKLLWQAVKFFAKILIKLITLLVSSICNFVRFTVEMAKARRQSKKFQQEYEAQNNMPITDEPVSETVQTETDRGECTTEASKAQQVIIEDGNGKIISAAGTINEFYKEVM